MLCEIFLGYFLLAGISNVGMALSFGRCQCAAMESWRGGLLLEKTLPLLPGGCGRGSSSRCSLICRILAKTSRLDPNAAETFCKKISRNITSVHVSIFSAACNEPLKYTGLTFYEPTCCTDGINVPCVNVTKEDSNPKISDIKYPELQNNQSTTSFTAQNMKMPTELPKLDSTISEVKAPLSATTNRIIENSVNNVTILNILKIGITQRPETKLPEANSFNKETTTTNATSTLVTNIINNTVSNNSNSLESYTIPNATLEMACIATNYSNQSDAEQSISEFELVTNSTNESLETFETNQTSNIDIIGKTITEPERINQSGTSNNFSNENNSLTASTKWLSVTPISSSTNLTTLMKNIEESSSRSTVSKVTQVKQNVTGNVTNELNQGVLDSKMVNNSNVSQNSINSTNNSNLTLENELKIYNKLILRKENITSDKTTFKKKDNALINQQN